MSDSSNIKSRPEAGLVGRNLSMTFKVFNGRPKGSERRIVFDNIELMLEPAKIVGLVGATGIGKTTLAKIMSGLWRPTGGTVIADGIRLFSCSHSAMRKLRRLIRYVPQNPDAVLDLSVSVERALEEGRLNSRLDPEAMKKWVAFLISTELVDQEWHSRSSLDLSLGQRRRVVNQRGLQSCPRYMIMDEPFNGLDIANKQQTLSLLRRAADEWGVGQLVISHDVEALEDLCDLVLKMSDSGLQEYNRPRKEIK